ncbi:MAG: hypothetical protein KGL53_16525 [Elusimicrobia bacterium]|nr:hypothetical protein [Elusimicrobiota bacterium]
MAPRSYEFTCRVCGKTVTESSDNEVCANCAMNPSGAGSAGMAPPPPPPPVQKTPPKGSGSSTTHNIGGFRVTIRTSKVCGRCAGKGVVDGKVCPACGGKKK